MEKCKHRHEYLLLYLFFPPLHGAIRKNPPIRAVLINPNNKIFHFLFTSSCKIILITYCNRNMFKLFSLPIPVFFPLIFSYWDNIFRTFRTFLWFGAMLRHFVFFETFPSFINFLIKCQLYFFQCLHPFCFTLRVRSQYLFCFSSMPLVCSWVSFFSIDIIIGFFGAKVKGIRFNQLPRGSTKTRIARASFFSSFFPFSW